MGTQLIQVVTFENVGAGQQATLAHNLNVNGRALVPDVVMRDNADFTIDAVDSASITVTNTSGGVATLNAWLEFKQTTQRWFGAQQTTALEPNPFIPAVGGGGGGGGGIDIENNGAPLAGGPFTTLNLAGATAVNAGGGVADVVTAHAFVFDVANNGGVVQNNGSGNSAPGLNALAGGGASTAIADHSTALGTSNVEATATHGLAAGTSNVRAGAINGTALGNSNVETDSQYGTALGNSNVNANSSYGTASGDSNATGAYSTALGGAIANGEAATALGYGDATGEGAFASGISSANGAYSTALGSSNALADYATSMGIGSAATRVGQAAQAAGQFATAGDAQTSVLVMRGETPGIGAGESVELTFGPAASQLTLSDDKAYTILVTAVASGVISGGPGTLEVQSYRRMFAVRKEGGVTTIAASGTLEQIGDAGSATWTLTGSVGAGPGRFVLTFDTAGTTAMVKCVARVEFTETAPISA